MSLYENIEFSELSGSSDGMQHASVLLVEDDRTTRHLVKNAMQDNCKMMTAPDISHGVDSFLNKAPDIVFLDIGLPDGNGHQALEFMLWNDPSAYIVMFSSHDDPENVSKAMDLGAKGFISKPFVKENMLEHLEKFTALAA